MLPKPIVLTLLGLPQYTYGHGYSSLSTKYTEELRVSPPVEGWVTDYGEADDMVGHLYKLSGPELDKVVASPEGKALQAKFASDIDDGGFDFPMKVAIKR